MLTCDGCNWLRTKLETGVLQLVGQTRVNYMHARGACSRSSRRNACALRLNDSSRLCTELAAQRVWQLPVVSTLKRSDEIFCGEELRGATTSEACGHPLVRRHIDTIG